MPGRLEGKLTAITGAGNGIGATMAHVFAEEGAQVAILDMNMEAARAVEDGINSDIRMGTAKAFQADVSDFAGLAEPFRQMGEWGYRALDVFVNNAGINLPCAIEDLDEREAGLLIKHLAVNIAGYAFCAHYALPLLKRGADPILINMGSAAIHGSEGQSVYAMTKAADHCLTLSLVKEWRGQGRDFEDFPQAVRVNTLAPDILEPTALRTEDYEVRIAKARRVDIGKVRAGDYTTKVPQGRVGTLREVAYAAVNLVTETYTNGDTRYVTGGKTVR